jgi:hypothetical protein
MELFINLGFWDVQVRSSQDELLRAIKRLFNHRTSAEPRIGARRLVCDVFDDPEKFYQLNATTNFDGPVIPINKIIKAEYSFRDGRTRIKVQLTGIIELTEDQPLYTCVYLEPLALSGNAVRPLPEAFFYPMLVEWMRNVDAYLVHCGAVSIDGKAIILIGPTGSGKSTHVLRMLCRDGVDFLADDLMILHRSGEELILMPFREVANLGDESVQRFPDMKFLTSAPRRGDGKFQVSIEEYFNKKAVESATPGVILHLYPEQQPWIRQRSSGDVLEGIHKMNFFISRTKESTNNFFILTDLMMASHHFDVSQGYMAENLDALMGNLSTVLQQ